VQQTREAEQRVSHNQRVEALGRLTGGVAHDFNNLLGVISNSAHLIQRQTALPALLVPVAATLRAVEVGSRLTQHLLRFSGRQPVQPRAVSLLSFLPDVRELMQTVVGKRIEVALDVEPGTPSVTVDPSELELALVNLALNARDAIEGSGHVWLRAAMAPAEDWAGLPAGEYVAITVGDDGKGLEESLAERVFEPFFSTKGVGKGTGLGLSQVHGFCVQAGGTAHLASTMGLGTTVTLVLPANPAPIDDALPLQPEPALTPLQGRRVLLVEDNDELAEVTEALLSSFGATVQRKADAAQALQVLQSGTTFDVVLSDVVMPGDMDGVALARRLQQDWPALPVVLISGYSSALANAGDLKVLRKPCAPEDLVAALEQAMAGPGRP
jgi:CheY-like chemotaxis protein